MAPLNLHFVGSIPLKSTSETFQTLLTSLPKGTLKRIPDGETGSRHYFVGFQREVFHAAGVGHVLRNPWSPTGFRLDFTAEEIRKTMDAFPTLETRYDEFAVESYATFLRLRSAGVVPQGTKFQVGIPSAANFIAPDIQPQFQALVEPHYEAALLRAIRNLQARIPHEDLAIQFDIAVDYGLLHGNLYEGIWYGPVTYLPAAGGRGVLRGWLAEKVARMVDAVEMDVEVGFHHCYGDVEGKHFMEPPDTHMISEYHLDISSRITHPVSWIHLPVPKARDDIAYLAPLNKLLSEISPETEIYLGLVHEHDVEGTKRKLASARSFFGARPFGVSTECGLGRRGRGDLESVLEIAGALCQSGTPGPGAVF